MGLFVKKSNTGSNDWVTSKSVWVKTGTTTWSQVKNIFVKAANGIWTLFYPKIGPYTTKSPYFSTDSAGANVDTVFDNVGNTIYGQNGTWNNNGYTLTSSPYSYQIWTYLTPSDSSPTKSTLTTYSSSVPILLSGSTYNARYISFYIQANTTSGTTGNDQSALLFVCRKLPVLISNSFNTSTIVDGTTLTYSSTWNTTDAYLADSTRRKIEWYKSTNGTYTTTSAIKAGAKLVKTATNPSSSDLSITVGTVGNTSGGAASTDVGNYFYVIETQYNSGTDYTYGSTTTGVETYLVSSAVVNANITQNTKPSISGSGVWNTSVTATPGTYSNYKSITTGIYGIISPGGTAPTDGNSFPAGGSIKSNSTTYTIIQSDVTAPIYLLYAYDTVTGYDNVVHYYFSASPVTPKVGTITDNFNRSISNGLGTSSYGLQWLGTLYYGAWGDTGSYAVSANYAFSANGSGNYPVNISTVCDATKIGYAQLSSISSIGGGLYVWKVCTPSAINPSGSPTNFPAIAIDMGYTTTRNMSVQFPVATQANGLGLVWWFTGAGLWYASSVYQYNTVATSYPCGSTQYSGTGSCTNGAGTASGQVCNCVNTTTTVCTGGTSTSLSPCSSQASNVCNCSDHYSTVYSCNGSSQTDSNSSCPTDTGAAGSVCNCSVSSSLSTYYYCDGASYYANSACTDAVSPATAPYQKCFCSQTGTTFTTYSFASGGYGYTPPLTSTTCDAAHVGYAQTGSITYIGGGAYSWNICSSSSSTQYAYQYSGFNTYTVTNYTRTYQTRSSTASSVFAYSQFQYSSTSTTNTYYLTTTSTTTTYNTNLRIYSANGSSVSTLVNDTKDSNTSGYASVAGMKVSTSGNTITAGIYSDSGLTSLIGSNSSNTPSSPTKSDSTYGTSGAGLFVGPIGDTANGGVYFDNLTMS